MLFKNATRSRNGDYQVSLEFSHSIALRTHFTPLIADDASPFWLYSFSSYLLDSNIVTAKLYDVQYCTSIVRVRTVRVSPVLYDNLLPLMSRRCRCKLITRRHQMRKRAATAKPQAVARLRMKAVVSSSRQANRSQANSYQPTAYRSGKGFSKIRNFWLTVWETLDTKADLYASQSESQLISLHSHSRLDMGTNKLSNSLEP